MNFLEKLDALMDERHLNKSRLAQLSGVPYTTIDGLYKKGYENTKLSTVRKIAKALSVSIDDLVEDAPEDEKSPGLSTEAMKLAQDYEILDIWGQKTVRAVTDSELARVRAAEDAPFRIEGEELARQLAEEQEATDALSASPATGSSESA